MNMAEIQINDDIYINIQGCQKVTARLRELATMLSTEGGYFRRNFQFLTFFFCKDHLPMYPGICLTQFGPGILEIIGNEQQDLPHPSQESSLYIVRSLRSPL